LVVFRAALAGAPPDEAIAAVDAVFGLDRENGAIVYNDVKRKVAKKAVADEGRLVGVRLAGETLAQSWLKRAMAEDELDANLIRFALAPSAKPPVNVVPRNIVCKCADVSDVQIHTVLAQGAGLPQLQDALKCGTFCGSCVPEIRKMVAEYAQQEAAA
jgi:assimilatory nitrate reductase catalytic subunit